MTLKRHLAAIAAAVRAGELPARAPGGTRPARRTRTGCAASTSGQRSAGLNSRYSDLCLAVACAVRTVPRGAALSVRHCSLLRRARRGQGWQFQAVVTHQAAHASPVFCSMWQVSFFK
jgi:hypothetical protein